jgi:hypothetical protein
MLLAMLALTEVDLQQVRRNHGQDESTWTVNRLCDPFAR